MFKDFVKNFWAGQPRLRPKVRRTKRPKFEAIDEFQLAGGVIGRILRPVNGQMARQVRPGWQTRATGTFDSRKAKSPLAWESALERDALLICEYDDNVIELRTQPYEVEIDTKPRRSRTYPDFAVLLSDKSRKIIQVKSDYDLRKPEVEQRLLRDQMIFEGLGWTYEVWRESYVRSHPILENAKLLHYFRKHSATPELRKLVEQGFRDRQGVTAAELCAATGLRMPDIHMLLAIRLLKTDLRQPLGPPSVLSRSA